MRYAVAVLLLPILVAAGAPAASAFETQTSDPFATQPAAKLSDDEAEMQSLSKRYTGNSATIYHSGNITIGIIGPGGGGYAAGNSPFVPDPAAGTVPSKRQW